MSNLIQEFQKHSKDTGSTEVQVVLLTKKITSIALHLKLHPKDFHSRRGLMQDISQRKSFLSYLKRTKPDRYSEVVQALGLRH